MHSTQVLCEVLHEDAQEVHSIGGVLCPVADFVCPRQQLHDVMHKLLEMIRRAVILHCSSTKGLTG